MIERLKHQRLPAGAMPYHEHHRAYAAITLEGSYHERGGDGCVVGQPGVIVIHLPFDRHTNVIGCNGAEVLNVMLTLPEALVLRTGQLADPYGSILALRQGISPLLALRAVLAASQCQAVEEADAVAHMLTSDGEESLDSLVGKLGVSGRTLRRQFQRLYGTTAATYRIRARTRRAWVAILQTGTPLSNIAADCGFADQSHMTRSVTALTGSTPSAWRRMAVSFNIQST